LVACREPSAPRPAGAWILAETAALRGLLEQIGEAPRTPAGQLARAALDRLPDCRSVFGFSADHDPRGLIEDLRCASRGAELPAWLSGSASLSSESPDNLLVGIQLEGAREPLTIRGWWREEGDVQMRLSAPTDLPENALPRALRPSSEPPPSFRLASPGALMHARFRTEGGLDLASWVQAGGAADRFFSLRSRLFTKVVLDGSWEIALYMPREGEALPPMAMALGLASRQAAGLALEQFLLQIGETWKVAPTRYGPVDGGAESVESACFENLRLLPGLAPCFQLGEEALVVAWNRRSLDASLALDEAQKSPGRAGRDAEDEVVRVDFALFPEAEARLTRAVEGERSPGADPAAGALLEASRYPWRSLEAWAEKDGDRFRYSMLLLAAERGEGEP
ncbi:MAG: hypothetical protein AAF725_27335, partial [Acidobacteriota bacterium]